MTRRPSSPNRPRRAQSSRELPIACHGAIKFLPRKRNISHRQDVFVCDSGCRSHPQGPRDSSTMRRAAAGFIQFLDYDPIPLCAKCLKEAKKLLEEIESQVVEN
jgi:hypothetical protein